MKIYIDNFDLKEVNINNKYLQDFCVLTKLYDDMYSNYGMYRIENAKILRKLNIIDGELIHMKNFIKNMNIFLDKTIIKKDQEQVMYVPNDVYIVNKIVKSYRLRDKSPLIMILEINTQTNEIYDLYFQLNESYAAYSEADMNNEFIKNDLISLIKLLC
jgi:hypothetical protein